MERPVRQRALARVALACGLAFAHFWSAAAAGEPPSVESQVTFGTTCARCHEGECSGRLSFGRSVDAASAHIERHAGSIAQREVRELYELLERMKKECRYPPSGIAVPEDGAWSAALLDRLCLATQRSCFVPLGVLGPGRYVLALELGEAEHVHVEVVTQSFEIPLEQTLESAGSARLAFSSGKAERHFLRLQAASPVRLERLALSRD